MTTDAQNMTDACAQAGEMTAEHELLKQFEGEWKAEVKMWMDPTADPMVSTGKMRNTLVLGGRFLEHDYRDDSGMFSGKGFWGYNTIEKRWEGVWLDTMATFMMVDQGSSATGSKTWTMTSEIRDPGSGHMMRKRSTVVLHDDGSHTMEMFFTPQAGEHAGHESKCMESNYAKG